MEINIRDWLWRRFSPSGLCQISEEVIGSDIKETLEISKNTLNAFKKKYANLKLREIDGRYLSLMIDEESCDVIIAISVLEHIPEYKIVIQEIKKCLKSHGIFICVVPTEKLGVQNWKGDILRYSNRYHKGYDFKELQTSLSENFQEVTTWFSPLYFPLFFSGVYQKR